MNSPLHDKIALVTGGGRGLGRAMALGLARAGARVVVAAARERAEIERVAAEAPKTAVVAFVADVTKEEDCDRLVAETLKRFGKLDVLINNAGRGMKYVSESFLTEPTRFWETDPEDVAHGDRHQRQRAVSDGACRRAADAQGWMGPHRQHLDVLCDHAKKGLFALWPVESGVGIRNSDLGAGTGRHGDHRECGAARRSDAHRDDPEVFPEASAAASSIPTSSFRWSCGWRASLRGRDGQTLRRVQMALGFFPR